MVARWWVRSRHLHVGRKLEEASTVVEHAVHLLLRDSMVDQVRKANIATGGVETSTDLNGCLEGQ